MRREDAARWIALALVAVAIFAAWANGLQGEWVYDDKVEVVGNKTIRFLDQWRMILSYNWSRPVTIASYALNFRASGMEPLSYHVIDVLIHVVNAGLALWLLAEVARIRGIAKPVLVAALGAGVWALHPLQTESVSYVTGRSEQLCASFYLLGSLLWVLWAERGNRAAFVGAWLAVGLGAFTKEVAITMPLAFFLLEWLGVRGGALKETRWAGYLPGVLGILAFFGLRWRVYGHFTSPHAPLRPLDVQIWTEAEVWIQYLRLTVLPLGQTLFHDYPETGLTARAAGALVALIAITAAALANARRAPLVALGWLWFALVLLPSSSIVPLKETMAEHRVHISLLGLSFIVVALTAQWPARRTVGLAAALLLILGSLTHVRNRVWTDEIALWTEATQRSPSSAEAWYGLGDALWLDQQMPAARDAYTRVTELDPEYLDGWNNLGRTEATLGNVEPAKDAWAEALKRSPSYCKAHNNLGLLEARQGAYQAARAEFLTTLQYCRKDCRAHRYLGELYGDKLGEKEQAVRHLNEFLALCPDDPMSEQVRAMRDRWSW